LNKKILLIFLFLLALPIVSAIDWCYQETANVSTACGGLDTGSYNDTTGPNFWEGGCGYGFCAYDGNWSSYVTGSSQILLINYTILSNATSGTWQVKMGNSTDNTTTNYTIPDSCWDGKDDISLKIFVDNSVPTRGIGYCYNSTGWEIIFSANHQLIYEEAMWWDISKVPAIALSSPEEYYNTTNENITFYFNVTATNLTNGTCILYIDNVLNQSKNISVWTYQENATLINCTGDWSDAINHGCEEVYDGDWGTKGYVEYLSGNATIYMNYTKPNGADNTSLWQIKYTDATANVNTSNMSIPSDCWSQNILQFKALSSGNTTGSSYPSVNEWYCYNGTYWNSLHRTVDFGSMWSLYEEAMWWHNTTFKEYDFAVNNIPQGTHNWSIECYDYDGFYNTTETRDFRINTPPNIYLISPTNNSFTTNTTPDFRFNVTDINEENISSCTLYIDATPYGNDSSVNHNVITTITANASINLNNHTWYISCYDGYNTTNSNRRNITIINIGLCNTTFNHTIVNFTYYDEVNDSIMNATNTYGLTIWDGTYYYNQTGAFINSNSNGFCTNLDPAIATYNWNLWGSFTLSAGGYITRVTDIDEGTPIAISNNPYTNQSLYLISLLNSSTVTYNWYSTNFDLIEGTMRIFKCNDDGSKSLVESIPIISGVGYANIQLLTQTYSYDITIDGVLYEETNGFSKCHIEALTDVTIYVDLGGTELAPQIGLASIPCTLTKIAPNFVRMVWSANPEDSSDIEGCIIAYRRTIYGNTEIYNNCTTNVYNRTVEIVLNGNEYIVIGKLKQNDFTVVCGDGVYFDSRDSTGGFWGSSGLLAAFFLIAALALMFAGRGDFMIMGTIVGVIGIAILGITNFGIGVISAMVALLVLVLFIGRYSRKQE